MAHLQLDRNGTGTAYIFQRSEDDPDQWVEVAKLLASDGASGDGFGESVAIYGDLVIVGAAKDPELDGFADRPGTAYVFARHAGGLNQWGEILELSAIDPQDGDHFGKSLDLFEHTAIVTAPGRDDNTGAAYIFELPNPASGDFNNSGTLDVTDIDQLGAAINSGQYDWLFDVNGDLIVDDMDQAAWVHDLKHTWFGDANWDGEFSTDDLVQVLESGSYEADTPSSWSTGDFDGNGRTDSGDWVLALADGGYEQGPRAAVNIVPEPSSFVMLLAGLMGIAFGRRRIGPDIICRGMFAKSTGTVT